MMFTQHFAAYSEWRSQLANSIKRFHSCLSDHDLNDAQINLRIEQLLNKLREDRLHVAFVAEFSRGKSELINAIFFADYGSRILPSAAGRTTMCPTELLFDPNKPPCLELLPIETRESNAGISECKRSPQIWQTIPLDISSAESMQQTLQQVRAVMRVDRASAEKFGFPVSEEEAAIFRVTTDGMVEIPRWRHAVINFPHPLLQQGLVILDTPGLNAIGTEPELTLSLLPHAHAVLFILAADAGVTQSDMTVWREHIGKPEVSTKGRMIILNKIDGLWDELKTPEEIDVEIAKQSENCARMLDLPTSQIFPVSAQKALVAKINNDAALLKRSRLPDLEYALSAELIPAKQEIVRDSTASEFSSLYTRIHGLLISRLDGLHAQLNELSELRGKNKGVVEYMMGKVRTEKEEFESGLKRYYAVRSVFSQLTNRLFGHLGLEALRSLTQTTRETMTEATFSKTLSGAMQNFFAATHNNLAHSDKEVAEILRMMEAIQKKFSIEHGFKLAAPAEISMRHYAKEINRLERWCDAHLGSMLQLMTYEKGKLIQKFFEEVASQVRQVFENANRDAESWLKSIMAPLETQVREHQLQLKRRLESIKRIHQATDTLEERIDELKHLETDLLSHIRSLEEVAQDVQDALHRDVSIDTLRSAA